jgi:hypothetical protein
MNNGRSFDTDDEREWEAQERARAAERIGAPLADEDATAQRYRVLARELGTLPRAALPMDFAEAVARRAAVRTVEPALPTFERVIVAMLIAAFVVAAAIGVAAFGLASPVIDAMRDVIAIAANRWALALAFCLAACAMTTRLRIPAHR